LVVLQIRQPSLIRSARMSATPTGPQRATTASPGADAAARGPSDVDRQSLDVLIGNVADILRSEVALYCRPGAEGRPAAVISSCGMGPAHERGVRPGEGGFVDRALAAERAVLGPLNDDHDAFLISAARGVRLTYAVAAPVRLETGTVGTLIAAFSSPPREYLMTMWAAESCAAMMALCLYETDLLAPLLQPASLDPLTGCLGYAGTRHELDREINRSTRRGLSLSVCFIDLDNFKRINDQHGHLHGNEVLAQVGRALRSGVRSCDSVGRFGGDEFVAILPETAEADAVQLAARMGSSIATASITSADQPLTASIGVAERTSGETADRLLARADQLMLLTKAHKDPRVTRMYLPPEQRQPRTRA
jgi:diguanylate cyclase (GGDEF)-like protein